MSDTDFPPCRWRDDSERVLPHRPCNAPVPTYAQSYWRVDRHDCARCPVREERSARERIVERIEAMMSADGPQAYTRERLVAIVEEELP